MTQRSVAHISAQELSDINALIFTINGRTREVSVEITVYGTNGDVLGLITQDTADEHKYGFLPGSGSS